MNMITTMSRDVYGSPEGQVKKCFSMSDLICFLSFVFFTLFRMKTFFFLLIFLFLNKLQRNVKKKSFLYLDFTHEKTFLQKTPPPVLFNINLLSWCFHFMFFFFFFTNFKNNKQEMILQNKFFIILHPIFPPIWFHT